MLRNIVFNDWFTILIIVCLVCIAIAKHLFAKRFNDFFQILGNSNYLKIYIKDQKFINTFDSLMFLNLIISTTVFIIIALAVFTNAGLSINIGLIYKLSLSIGAMLIIKVLMDRLIGSLFEIDEIINVYVFHKITFKNYIGLVLLPINILLIFAINPSKSIIYLVILLLFAINIVGFIMALKSYQKVIKSNLFYLILYLCALEIAPYLILFKVFKSF